MSVYLIHVYWTMFMYNALKLEQKVEMAEHIFLMQFLINYKNVK